MLIIIITIIIPYVGKLSVVICCSMIDGRSLTRFSLSFINTRTHYFYTISVNVNFDLNSINSIFYYHQLSLFAPIFNSVFENSEITIEHMAISVGQQ